MLGHVAYAALLLLYVLCMVRGQLSAVIGRENTVVSDSFLPKGVFDYLASRLDHISAAGHSGASTFYVPIGAAPRSAIEGIVQHIARRVFGNRYDEEVANGLRGAEWWIQYRNSSGPKEYHLDTAISYCEKHGIVPISNCPFYPGIASVLFLGEHGGPTVIFNQTMTARGLSPPLSTFASIVPPQPNRMLLFKGDLLHGVIGDDEMLTRKTLLINYWYDKFAGAEETVVLEDEDRHIRHAEELFAAAHGGGGPVTFYTPVTFQSGRSFAADFDIWRSQRVPLQLYTSIEALVGTASGGGVPSSFSLGNSPFNVVLQDTFVNGHFHFLFSDLGVGGFVVGNWALWELNRANGTFRIPSIDRGRYLEYFLTIP